MLEHNCLIEAACQARRSAYAPYSQFPVGAALFASSGRLYTGCNIENSSFGLTVCAERVAIFQAVAAGEHKLDMLAVVADSEQLPLPCGACLQVMAEFGITKVLVANIGGDSKVFEFSQLYPQPFNSDILRS